MKSLVFEADGMNAHLSRYKLDRVSVGSKVDEVTALGGARRSGDGSLDVLWLHARHCDVEFTLTADCARLTDGLLLTLDAFKHSTGRLTANVDCERTSCRTQYIHSINQSQNVYSA